MQEGRGHGPRRPWSCVPLRDLRRGHKASRRSPSHSPILPTHSNEQDSAEAPMRVALYARVSTSNGQQDPEMQLRELRQYAERREFQIVKEYTDNGVSGSKDSRPALNQLRIDAGQRSF